MEKSAWGQGSLGKVNIITLATLLPAPIIISLLQEFIAFFWLVPEVLHNLMIVSDYPFYIDKGLCTKNITIPSH